MMQIRLKRSTVINLKVKTKVKTRVCNKMATEDKVMRIFAKYNTKVKKGGYSTYFKFKCFFLC